MRPPSGHQPLGNAAQPHDLPPFLYQFSGLGLHQQMEARITPAAGGKEFQKIPLRHQGDEFAGGRQRGEIRGVDCDVAEEAGEPAHLPVRQL